MPSSSSSCCSKEKNEQPLPVIDVGLLLGPNFRQMSTAASSANKEDTGTTTELQVASARKEAEDQSKGSRDSLITTCEQGINGVSTEIQPSKHAPGQSIHLLGKRATRMCRNTESYITVDNGRDTGTIQWQQNTASLELDHLNNVALASKGLNESAGHRPQPNDTHHLSSVAAKELTNTIFPPPRLMIQTQLLCLMQMWMPCCHLRKKGK